MLIGDISDTDGFLGWDSNENEPEGFLFCFSATLQLAMLGLFIWMILERDSVEMIRHGYDTYPEKLVKRNEEKEREREREEMMHCHYCNVEHKIKNKEKHLKKCIAIEKEKLAKLEAKKKKENDPNLMTAKRKFQLEEIADRVFPNARYFKFKGEKMELTTDIGSFKYSSCNSKSIESIDKEMVADATRGYNRRNKPKSKNKSSVTKSYSGICSQQKRNHSTCGSPTDSRCPRCSRYACGSCRGSRTYNGRRVCEACNRNMSGD